MSKRSFPPKDFQLATIARVYAGLFGTDGNASGRMLVADEVGLGKTIVAKEVIQRALADKPDLSVVYICNNAQIAAQNLRKLDVSEGGDAAVAADRLTMIGAGPERSESGLRLLSLTPGTSFNLRSQGGRIKERAFLYHLLRRHTELRRNRRLGRLISLGCKVDNWTWWVKHMKDAQADIVKTFHEQLTNSQLLQQVLDRCASSIGVITGEDFKLVGRLRQLLAEVSLGKLAPDLIILDEFQRFRQLLAVSTEMGALEELAHRLFNDNEARLLLLSATPFRMLTLRAEDQAGEDHYADFHFLIRFLLGDHPERQTAFRKDWNAYSLLMAQGPKTDLKALEAARTQVQRTLRSVICRTERADLSAGLGDTLIRETVPLQPTTEDMAAYIAGERLAERYRKKSHRLYDLINFYKSAPYPFSYLTDYQFARAWKQEADDETLERERARAIHWVPLEKINAYEKIAYPCAAFRGLLNHLFTGNTERLLWVPPALPTYPLTGVFTGRRGFTKALLFSNYRMVPRSVATLMSYEAERRVIRPLLERGAYGREVTYSNQNTKTTTEEKTGRYLNRLSNTSGSKTNLSLLYPCVSLASLPLPDVPTSTEALNHLAEEIRQRIQRYGLDQDGSTATEADVNWYWQLPILLDRMTFGSEELCRLYETEEIVPSIYQSAVLRLLSDPLDEVLAKLGARPGDLEDIVALQVLGSPATVGLRLLLGEKLPPLDTAALRHLLNGSRQIAEAFRRLFNRPDPTAIVALSAQGAKTPYWQSVLAYCRDGDLLGMLREYRYVTINASGYQEAPEVEKDRQFLAALEAAMGLQTASFSVKAYATEMRLRTSFAAVFANEKGEDGTRQREERLRAGFNSPFRPFVLASTSVGQEGLDFHTYAHHLWHWNLPANAVDLEQREGRINRYQHHAIRLHLAERYGERWKHTPSPWELLFQSARADAAEDVSDIVPDWHVGQDVRDCTYQLKSFVPTLPYSKDERRLRELERTLPLYRLALGQPDQEGLMEVFREERETEELTTFREAGVLRLGGRG